MDERPVGLETRARSGRRRAVWGTSTVRRSVPPRAAATVPAAPIPSPPPRDRNGRVRVAYAAPPRGHDERTHRSHVAAPGDCDVPRRLCGGTARSAGAADEHALRLSRRPLSPGTSAAARPATPLAERGAP